MFHRECAIPTTSWYDDCTCTELYQLIPILECLSKVSDVRPFLKAFVKDDRVLFAKASQVLRGGKLGERTQSQQRLNDVSFSGKEKTHGYKKRTTSERRHQKNSSNPNKVISVNQENCSTLKTQSRYNNIFKGETKESQSVKHNSTKLDKNTPRHQTKYHSRFDNSTERSSKNGLNTSKNLGDKQAERHSSRKRERDSKKKIKKGSKGRYSSLQRQEMSDNVDTNKKERGSSALTRTQSTKEYEKESRDKYTGSLVYNTNCDYKKPEEFHKLRYSFASNVEVKSKRPSSAKRKEENLLCNEKQEDKHKNESSRNGSNRHVHRSRSNRDASRESEKSDRHQEKQLSKAKSSTNIEFQNKQPSFHHTASLKFNSILKDIGVHGGNAKSAHVINYQDKSREGDCDDKNRKDQDYDNRSSKYYSNLESSLKSKGRDAMKAVDAFMMTSNTNHHYMLNHNNAKNYQKEQGKNGGSGSNQQNDNSFNNLNSSFKGRNPVIGISSIVYGSNKNVKKLHTNVHSESNHRVEDPAIPFPNSQRHQSSKAASSDKEYCRNRPSYSSIPENATIDCDQKENQAEPIKYSREQKYYSYLDKF